MQEQIVSSSGHRVTMHLGDCLEVMKHIPDGSVDMVLCDLPYGTTACKWDSVIPFEPLWTHYRRVAKPSAAIVLFGAEPFSSSLRLSAIDLYRYDWYWQKDKAANFLFGNKQPLKVVEVISVFYRAQPVYNPQKTANPNGPSTRHLHKNPAKITKHVREVMGDAWKETKMGETQNYHGANYEPDKLLPKSLVYCAREQRGKQHPTQKPVALCEYLIKTYTNEGATVLDNCAGSGTTGAASIRTGRNAILIEKDADYFTVACKRVRAEAILTQQERKP
ncbi:MAG: methyltransferase [Chloroflexota bacterium]|nr:MAG: methyltransferase [Chloroflexota bacterium]